MNGFNCEIERACNSFFDLMSQKKTFSTDVNMLKRKPPNENHASLLRRKIWTETKYNWFWIWQRDLDERRLLNDCEKMFWENI